MVRTELFKGQEIFYHPQPRVDGHDRAGLIDFNMADGKSEAALGRLIVLGRAGEFVVMFEKVTFQQIRSRGTPNSR